MSIPATTQFMLSSPWQPPSVISSQNTINQEVKRKPLSSAHVGLFQIMILFLSINSCLITTSSSQSSTLERYKGFWALGAKNSVDSDFLFNIQLRVRLHKSSASQLNPTIAQSLNETKMIPNKKQCWMILGSKLVTHRIYQKENESNIIDTNYVCSCFKPQLGCPVQYNYFWWTISRSFLNQNIC